MSDFSKKPEGLDPEVLKEFDAVLDELRASVSDKLKALRDCERITEDDLRIVINAKTD